MPTVDPTAAEQTAAYCAARVCAEDAALELAAALQDAADLETRTAWVSPAMRVFQTRQRAWHDRVAAERMRVLALAEAYRDLARSPTGAP